MLGHLLVLSCLLIIFIRNECLSFIEEISSPSRRALQVVPFDTIVSVSSTVEPSDFSWTTFSDTVTPFLSDANTSPYSNCLRLTGSNQNNVGSVAKSTISGLGAYYDVSVSYYTKIAGLNGQDDCVVEVEGSAMTATIVTTLGSGSTAFPADPQHFTFTTDFQTSITIRAQLNGKETTKECYVCNLLVQGRRAIPSAAPRETITDIDTRLNVEKTSNVVKNIHTVKSNDKYNNNNVDNLIKFSGSRTLQAVDEIISGAFPVYSTTNTDSAQQNTVDQTFTACPGTIASFSQCSGDGGSCSGDTYLRLFNAADSEVALDDDGCGATGGCSIITYTFTDPCQVYTLKQGCFGTGSCSGTVFVSGVFTTRIPGGWNDPSLFNDSPENTDRV